MLRSSLTAFAIVLAAILAFPLYVVMVLGTRRSVHYHYGP